MSKLIELDLFGILDGGARLRKLKERVRQSAVKMPDTQGSGETLQAVCAAAEAFEKLETTWEELIEESVNFFEKVEESHRNTQEQLSKGMNCQKNG